MSLTCFLLDENVSPVIQTELKRKKPTICIYAIGDGIAPPKGASDPDILIWIESQRCMLVTNNRASMPVHLSHHLSAGRHVPGIVQLPKQVFTLRLILDDLLLIWELYPGRFASWICKAERHSLHPHAERGEEGSRMIFLLRPKYLQPICLSSYLKS